MISRTARPLRGWKEIADYFGMSTATMMRWHKVWALPVNRITSRGGVMTTTTLIDAWISTIDRIQRQEEPRYYGRDKETTWLPPGVYQDGGSRRERIAIQSAESEVLQRDRSLQNAPPE